MINKLQAKPMAKPSEQQANDVPATFKSKAGTTLPLLNLKGKPYLQAAHRFVLLNEEHSKFEIKTEFLHMDDSSAVCKGRVTIFADDGSVLKYAEATKREDKSHFADFVEKAESSSIARALAMLGMGTQFTTQEFEEKERIVDSPVQPAVKAQPSGTAPSKLKVNVEPMKPELKVEDKSVSVAQELGFDEEEVKASPSSAMDLINALEKEGISQNRIFQRLGVEKVFDISEKQLVELKTSLDGIKSGKLLKAKEFPVKNFAPQLKQPTQ